MAKFVAFRLAFVDAVAKRILLSLHLIEPAFLSVDASLLAFDQRVIMV